MGLTRKILYKIASEQNEVCRADFRTTIRIQFSGTGEEFVTVDESSKDECTLSHRYGRSLWGHRAELKALFVHGDCYSLVAVMSTNGYIAIRVVEGSVESFEFFDFIVKKVVPKMCLFPDAQSVLVMDNCHIHHNKALQDFLNAAEIMLLYLPPYSPDLNPIEELFSAWKAYLRCDAHLIRDANDQILTLFNSCGCITVAKARAWFQHAGYIVND
ncbi:transposase orfb [Moniliophthora roreri MCA 2997]|uniref:Transposase orfb n=2 Tax=Moniliophthora roreri TaxID=221103 RepID=V2X4X7_MONRO|nr:transposase orfb [Moniliophthora roreri MCA 2997]KAI3613598.1 transposase orfb [Moniliophthora roreri]